MEDKQGLRGLSVNVSMKDTWHFQRLLELLGKVLTNDKIPKEVRQELFEEINVTFESE